MNPKHFHTPVSTRLRCPVCHQPVYSRGGIHPQCAMRQSEPALPPITDASDIIAETEGAVAAIIDEPLAIEPAGAKRKHAVSKA
jgi:hypothetical protein